jgi:hypothetical protein
MEELLFKSISSSHLPSYAIAVAIKKRTWLCMKEFGLVLYVGQPTTGM